MTELVTDWTRQTETLTRTWLDNQKKVWDAWLASTQPFDQAQAAGAWTRTIAAWEESVKNILSAEVEWAATWAEKVKSVKGVPREAAEYLQQTQEMTRRWNEAQQALWDGWFALLKKVDPEQVPATQNLVAESQKIFQTWKDAAQNLVEAQTEWANRLAARKGGEQP